MNDSVFWLASYSKLVDTLNNLRNNINFININDDRFLAMKVPLQQTDWLCMAHLGYQR